MICTPPTRFADMQGSIGWEMNNCTNADTKKTTKLSSRRRRITRGEMAANDGGDIPPCSTHASHFGLEPLSAYSSSAAIERIRLRGSHVIAVCRWICWEPRSLMPLTPSGQSACSTCIRPIKQHRSDSYSDSGLLLQVRMSVGLSTVRHNLESCKNGRVNRDAEV